MVASPSGRRYTLREYLDFEEANPTRSELIGGEIFGMAGASVPHSALATTLIGLLFARLVGKPCVPHGSDLRIAARGADFYTYADASIVCGEPELHPDSPTHVTNPVVVVEVLSDSTEEYDRGQKRLNYMRIDALRHYVLVAQDRRAIEVYSRVGDAWKHAVFGAGELVLLPAIDITLPVDELYERARVDVP